MRGIENDHTFDVFGTGRDHAFGKYNADAYFPEMPSAFEKDVFDAHFPGMPRAKRPKTIKIEIFENAFGFAGFIVQSDGTREFLGEGKTSQEAFASSISELDSKLKSK